MGIEDARKRREAPLDTPSNLQRPLPDGSLQIVVRGVKGRSGRSDG